MDDKTFNELLATIKDVAVSQIDNDKRILGLCAELVEAVKKLRQRVAILEAQNVVPYIDIPKI